jgi:hypothetical protein
MSFHSFNNTILTYSIDQNFWNILEQLVVATNNRVVANMLIDSSSKPGATVVPLTP